MNEGSWMNLVRRYAEAFSSSWAQRGAMDAPALRSHEAEFLPSVLSLRDTPVHPAPRLIIAIVAGMLLLALAWAALGKVDVIASAPGKIIPSGDVETIQPQDTAVVVGIHAKDGQHVRRGDLLVELNASDAISDGARAAADLASTRYEIARGRAMLAAIDRGEPARLDAGDSVGPQVDAERHVLEGEYADYMGNIRRMKADIAQASASLQGTEEEIHKLETTLPIEERKERDYSQLLEKGYVGKHDYYNEEQAVIQLKQDLAIQLAHRKEIGSSLEAAKQKLSSYTAEVRREWLEKIHDDDQKAKELEQDLSKAAQHQRLMKLTAPEDGTVQQLAVHTVGGVVTPAQVLMTLVPDHRTLEVQAIVDNQDIGFIKEGQEVEVKVETFSYTRYGTIRGHVIQVSNDAKQDDKLGLIFTAQVALETDKMQIDERTIHLTPGMAVTAEIKTGRRRVLSYLLSPLLQHANEAMHER